MCRRDVEATLKSSSRTEEVARENQADLRLLSQNQKDSSNHLAECIASAQNAIIARCQGPFIAFGELVTEFAELQKMLRQLLSCFPTDNVTTTRPPLAAPSNDEFLQTFVFRHMDDREASIAQAHARTYEWIFEQESDSIHGDRAQSAKCSPRAQAKRELRNSLAELGIDTNDLEKIMNFHAVGEFPTASFQKWLESGDGIL